MAKRAEIDKSVLRHSEVVEYERLTQLASSNSSLPANAAHRLRVAGTAYILVWVIGIVVAAAVGNAMFGMAFSIGAAMYAAFTLGCFLGVAFTIQSAFATDRARKDRLRAADAYLESIGYRTRLGSTQVDDRNDYQFKSRRQMQHEWYGDHSELDWRDRERAELFGMDADTYVSNFLENDKD